MTLVGDVAQVGSAAGASSWGEVLEPYVQDRWRIEQLTGAVLLALAGRLAYETR